MAVPRRDTRRNNVWKLDMPGFVKCPKCGATVMPHRACKACGTYNGRTVIAVKAE